MFVINCKRICLAVAFAAVFALATAQSEQQAALLRKAYDEQSTDLLFEFFNNWSEEVQSNETEAHNPYVAEAHKVYAAFYQPLQPEKIGFGFEKDTYKDMPFFIVQGSLYEISLTKHIPKKWGDKTFREILPVTTLDSAVEFRPPVHFNGKKIVYLSDGYKKLLDNFFREKRAEFGFYSENQVFDSLQTEENLIDEMLTHEFQVQNEMLEFIRKAAMVERGHWVGWQYETYPTARQIIFNSKMTRAVVLFQFIYRGGEAIMEKRHGKWLIVDGHFTWIM